MSVELNDDYCPACKVPFTEHLGLVGTCKQLQGAKELLREIRDGDVNPEDEADKFLRDHQLSELTKAKGEIARLRAALGFQVGQKLKYHEALEEAVKMLGMDRPISPRQMMIEALSPSAPTSNLEDIGSKLGIEPSAPAESVEIDDIQFIETPSTLHQEAIKEYLRLTDPFAAPAEQEVSQGEWCAFVPSPENPAMEGDHIKLSGSPRWCRVERQHHSGFDGAIYRRFHPTTTNQDQSE